MRDTVKDVMFILFVSAVIGIVFTLGNLPKDLEKVGDPTSAVYIICDVVDVSLDTSTFVAEMPDGSLQMYSADDLPEGFDLVCFETTNQDDYSSYKVVALR